jgi:hypothetical protein
METDYGEYVEVVMMMMMMMMKRKEASPSTRQTQELAWLSRASGDGRWMVG